MSEQLPNNHTDTPPAVPPEQGMPIEIQAAMSGVEGLVDRTVTAAGLTLNGLRTRLAERRLRNTHETIDELETSTDVHQNAAARMLIPGRPKEADPIDEKNRVEQDNYIINDYHTSLRPITRSQKRQALRSDRRLRKNMRQAVVNRTHELTYNVGGYESDRHGSDELVIGTPEHSEVLDSERLTRAERRVAKGTVRQHKRNAAAIDRRVGRVVRSASGHDIPGKVIDRRLEHQLSRTDRLQNNIRRLGEKRTQRQTDATLRRQAREKKARELRGRRQERDAWREQKRRGVV